MDAVARHGHGVAVGLERLHEAALLRGGHAAEDRVLARRVADGLLGRERARVDEAVGVFDAGALGHLGHRARIVAGDDLHGHALAGKVAERLRRLGTDLVREQDQRDGQQVGAQRLVRERAVIYAQQQHAAALGGVALDLLLIRVFPPGEQHVRRAEQIGLFGVERHAAVFLRRRERQRRRRVLRLFAREVAPQGRHRVVVGLHGVDVVGHDHADVLEREAVVAQGADVLDDHLVFRHGAGFVHAQRVHARERLDAAELVHEGLALGQTHDAGHEREAGQQIQPLGDHADDGADCARHGDGRGAVKPHELLNEHHHAERDDEDADPLDEVLQRAHHLRLLRLLGALGLLRQARDVGIRADVRQLRAAHAADDEAARQELVAGVFLDLIRFARDERLVDVAALGRDHGVGIDLVAGGEDDDVVAHELRGVHGHAPAVAHGDGLGGRENVELVECFLRADLLNDADGSVDDDDAHERQVQPLLHRDHAQRQQEKQHIKIGKDIAQDDLLDRLARRVDGRVRPAGVGTLTHLRARQALLRVGVRDGHVPPLRRLGRGGALVFDFFDQIGQRSASRMRIPNIIAFRAMEWNNSL